MRSQNTSPSRRPARRAVVLATAVALIASGCSAEAQRGFLPGYQDEQVTNQTERITDLWVGSWIAALIVGLITWGLILWCVTVYRKRKSDDKLPIQIRYHVPLEITYVVLPIILIGVLFFYTARDISAIEDVSTADPDTTIQVVGKQWSWDFNYLDEGVYESGVHAQDVGEGDDYDQLPTLYLPVDERVEFVLDARDVIHSFWIPAFLYKKDMIPGRTNVFQVIPTREGVYAGKCAEFCGEEHSSMLFNVAVVSREEFDAQMDALRERGQTGALGMELNRTQDATSAAEGTQRNEN
ncbi:cytochrome c oxidase subunit II [uncultured Cellulomonas sp.]|uniref:aa3-type cytochrome oxidase subunit II n=1 Tax=uncultured Cellulomonas sp. TaxID=189682 RepID=UPI00262C970C|nr:cytochrome c oxidase subunit II [uncultured Cellulomonas sp.]